MKWLKVAVFGMAGSLIMFLLMMFGIHRAGIAHLIKEFPEALSRSKKEESLKT